MTRIGPTIAILGCHWSLVIGEFVLRHYNAAMPYVLFLMICTIWGGSFLLMKKATLVFSPVSVGAWRVAGGAAVLALLWLWRQQPIGWRRRDVGSLVFVIVAGYVWPYTIQAWLIEQTRHSAFIGMSVSFTPLFTMLASVPLLGIIPTMRQVIGVFGALCAMALLAGEGLAQNIAIEHMALAVTVPLGYALVNTWIRRRLTHVPPLMVTFVAMSLATGILLPWSFVAPSPANSQRSDVVPAVASLAILGIFGTGLAMFWFNKLIHDRGPLFAGMVTNLVPAGAVLWGWLDRETISARQLLALAILLPMVALVQFGNRLPQIQPDDHFLGPPRE